MKKFLLLLLPLVLIGKFSKAQAVLDTLPEIDGKVGYESIVDITEKNKDFIYYNAGKWILDIPNNVTGKVLTQDQTEGQIFADGSFYYDAIDEGIVTIKGAYRFKIQVDCKDNKYRIRISEITCTWVDGSSDNVAKTMEDINKYLKNSKATLRHTHAANVDSIFRGIISSLQDAITKAAKDDF